MTYIVSTLAWSKRRSHCGIKIALSGCQQSSRLWYFTLKKAILDFGFDSIENDPCVLKYCRDEENKMLLGCYVDDLFIASKNQTLLNEFNEPFRDTFKEITVNEGSYHSYLGINFTFKENGDVRLSMEGFMKQFLMDNKINCMSIYPARSNPVDHDQVLVPIPMKSVCLQDGARQHCHLDHTDSVFFVK